MLLNLDWAWCGAHDVVVLHASCWLPTLLTSVPAPSPLFVTWKRVSRHGEGKLRGCIGVLEPRQLATALGDYALTRCVCMCTAASP